MKVGQIRFNRPVRVGSSVTTEVHAEKNNLIVDARLDMEKRLLVLTLRQTGPGGKPGSIERFVPFENLACVDPLDSWRSLTPSAAVPTPVAEVKRGPGRPPKAAAPDEEIPTP